MPRITPTPKRVLTPVTLPEYFAHYLADKQAVDALTAKVNGMKATLMAYLEEHGIENEKGHRTLVVDGVGTMTREQRISEVFLDTVAERWLKRKGKRDEVIKEVMVEEWDFDAFMALLYEEKVPQSVVDTFYERNPVFAFKAKRA